MPTLHQLACEMSDSFETATRDNGAPFVRLRDGRPDWMLDVVFAAHDRGEIPPDDRLYHLTREAVDFIRDAGADFDPDDSDHEFAETQVDYANAEFAQWLANNPAHAASCVDEYNDEFGNDQRDIFKQLQGGQYVEARNVFGAVIAALQDLASDDSDDSDA